MVGPGPSYRAAAIVGSCWLNAVVAGLFANPSVLLPPGPASPLYSMTWSRNTPRSVVALLRYTKQGCEPSGIRWVGTRVRLRCGRDLERLRLISSSGRDFLYR